ncbi:MAG TPA: hypothetical protein VMP67_02420 [Candidatus Limnocylindria bacterium]|nr:hypothetical protein [Candidatus Limnocylindria bacterium]
MGSWWAGKSRQFWRHLSGRVSAAERRALTDWLTAAQLELFDGMHRADRRHGLDVVAALRRAGHEEPDLLLAGLLHDCGKSSHVGLWHRVGWSLAERYGPAAESWLRRLPGFGRAFKLIADHPRHSADLARASGCSERTAQLIHQQAGPADSELDRALRLADEAS